MWHDKYLKDKNLFHKDISIYHGDIFPYKGENVVCTADITKH